MTILENYPIAEIRQEVEPALEANTPLLVDAPPGSGKSTILPLYLLEAEWRKGRRIFLLQPRRAAVRSIAERLRRLIGSREAVGHMTRHDRQMPDAARIVVMTEGIFSRKLIEDPELADGAAVILDEFHERALETDLSYVLAEQCRELFRPDLRLIVMSATIDRGLFGNAGFRCLRAGGRLHPVEVDYAPCPTHTDSARHGAEVCRGWMEAHDEGSILFFLPGEGEIRRAEAALREADLPENVEIHPLYGRLSPEMQAKAIEPPPSGRRKIVAATNVAETSLTIEGIRCVVDSGLRRKNVLDERTGLERLETVRISAASAEQRAGRAGRLGPGEVIRLWDQRERLEDFDAPEIRRSDLSGLFLRLAVWGDSEGKSCRWPEPPPGQRQEEALELLRELGAVDERLAPTEGGRLMARLPVSPRLAAMLVDAAASGAAVGDSVASGGDPRGAKHVDEAAAERKSSHRLLAEAALAAALLENGDPLTPAAAEREGADLSRRIELLRDGSNRRTSAGLKEGAARRIHKEAKRLQRAVVSGTSGAVTSVSSAGSGAETTGASGSAATSSRAGIGFLIAAAYPDRIARRLDRGTEYLLASGVQAHLSGGEHFFAPDWIVAASLHLSGRRGKIHLAAELTQVEIEEILARRATDEQRLDIDDEGRLAARKLRSLGRIVVSETAISPAELEAGEKALARALRERGIEILPWTKKARQLHDRLAFLRAAGSEPAGPGSHADADSDPVWPDVSEEALLAGLEQWLLPFVPHPLRKDSLQKLSLTEALLSLLPWRLRNRLDELAPEQYPLPSGSKTRLRYEGARCVLSARIQQLFGMRETPKVAGGVPVEIELLSPAGRPMQITRDLRSFWTHTYPEVRKELRGRYPKHHWPEDPLTAEPTDRTRPK